MTSLVKAQVEHAYRLGKLLAYAEQQGILLRVDCSGCQPCDRCGAYHHRPTSLHRDRLATDIDIYDAGGKPLTDSQSYQELGLYWESIGGTWGGRFNDGRHFSTSYGGRK